jgi:uncharacterized protein
LERLAAHLGKGVGELTGSGVELVKQSEEFKTEVGDFTFTDIVAELAKPGRDPREEFSAFAFREDIHQVSDLTPGMICPGIVTNVTNFGAFVDIGVHQDGLVHISQLSNRFVKDPREIVNPGDRVTVRVLEVNLEKQQIALTMRTDAETSRQMPRDRRAETPAENQPRRTDRPKDRGRQDHRPDSRQERKPSRPEKPAFNNPFAEQLSKIKK